MKNADAVICVYDFIIPYAKKMGSKNISVIYNKVDLNKFSPECSKEFISTKNTTGGGFHLTIAGITGLALVDAVNPCALAVLIIFFVVELGSDIFFVLIFI